MNGDSRHSISMFILHWHGYTRNTQDILFIVDGILGTDNPIQFRFQKIAIGNSAVGKLFKREIV
jgi:hypothetical protein